MCIYKHTHAYMCAYNRICTFMSRHTPMYAYIHIKKYLWINTYEVLGLL